MTLEFQTTNVLMFMHRNRSVLKLADSVAEFPYTSDLLLRMFAANEKVFKLFF